MAVNGRAFGRLAAHLFIVRCTRGISAEDDRSEKRDRKNETEEYEQEFHFKVPMRAEYTKQSRSDPSESTQDESTQEDEIGKLRGG
ncbi:MAG TPA: hypothetical protein DCP63_15575 [Bacteroidetes bacterium]|nr:hypothetical protein [Bacteroidota bacterium]